PARLIGRRDPSGGRAECLLLERIDDARWHALVHPGQKLRPGARLVFEDPVRAPGIRLRAMVHERLFFGRRVVSFEVEGAGSIDEAVDRLGHIPLPPYIHREDTELDRERYQTVFARVRGSIAAPTAGLHFTGDDIERLRQAGIGWTTVTHHVGYGTFKPVRVERVEEHEVDAETYEVPAQAAEAIAGVRRAGGRIVAVGTTTTRALESAAADDGPGDAAPVHSSLLPVPGRRCAGDELPPAAIVAADAGGGFRRSRPHSRCLPLRRSARLSLLQLRRCHGDPLSRAAGRTRGFGSTDWPCLLV